MSCGIYKITNQINGKVYIGQSVNIEKRWTKHRKASETMDYPIYRAMRKYSLENFSFEIIEECSLSELNKRESFWIQFYSSALQEKGYNLTLGGSSSSGQSLTLEDVLEISNLLLTTDLGNQEIGKIYEVSENIVSGINTGYYWKRDISYPIRVKEKEKTYFCECGAVISKGAKKCTACHGLKRRAVERPPADVLKEEIAKLGFTGVGRKYGVSDNAIRKWCKSYEMPTTIKAYNIRV